MTTNSDDLKTTENSTQRIAVIPGDGIGVDVTKEAVRVLEAAMGRFSIPLELVHIPWSADTYLKTGVSLPEGAFEDFRKNYAAILVGAFGDPRVPDMQHAKDILLGMRFELDLFVNERPVRALADRLSPLKKHGREAIDMVIFRENTEGAYVGMGGIFKKGTADEVAIQEDISTRKGVERIIRHAFQYARQNGKTKVCMADKSNVMRYGGDLWLRVFDEVSAQYPEMETWHLYVDALTMQMIKDPSQFDVIVTNNMFGDIITDLGAALQGGMGLAASGNVHPGQVSMFEPIHGSAPKYTGTGRANPMGAILSVQMMLHFLGHVEASQVVERAVAAAVERGATTPDLGGDLSTSQVGDRIVAAVTEG